MSNRLLAGVCRTAVLIFLSCSVIAGDEIKFGKISPEEWQIGAPADYPEANAVIIFSRAHLQLKDDYIIIECHYRIKILTEAGMEKVGNRSIVWHKDYDKVKKFSAQTITPDGKKQEVEKNAIFTKEAGDYLEKTFTFPALQPGCIIEYSFTVINERFWYLSPWYFQTGVYTLKSSFSVSLPNGYVYNVLYQNVPPTDRTPQIEERPNMDGNLSLGETIKTFTWEQTNLPPITDEPYMSSENDYRSSLRFQIVSYDYRGFKWDYWEGWDKKAEFLEKQFDVYCDAGGKIRQLVEQVTAGLTGKREKSQAIYNWIVSEYRSVSEYESHYFGHERMSEFIETKSGTGEEKNMLLVRMHKEAGIPCWPVMISTREHAKLDPEYPDLRQFDYLIGFVQFDNDFEFLDCSGRLTPYGLLPPNCLVSGGLLLDGKNSQLVRVRGQDVYSGRTDRTTMYVGSDGLVTCSTLCSFRGYYASGYGERYERTKPEDFIKENFLDKLNSGYQLGNYECRLDTADIFVMTADYTVEDVVDRLDNNLVIRPVGYAFRNNPFESRKRFFPVDFNYPFTYKNVVEIRVSDSVQRYMLPPDTLITIPGASFARQCHQSDSGATVITTLIIEKPEFLPHTYGEVRNFFDQVAKAAEDDVTAVLVASSE